MSKADYQEIIAEYKSSYLLKSYIFYYYFFIKFQIFYYFLKEGLRKKTMPPGYTPSKTFGETPGPGYEYYIKE